MKRAVSLLRQSSHYAAESFACGLRALGYVLSQDVDALGQGDVLLTWNRHGSAVNEFCERAAKRGAHVVVAENGYFGRDWRGDTWFALALDHHNGAGRWPRDDGKRWREIGFELEPWRGVTSEYREVVILPQRGIGEPGIAMPLGWTERAQARISARVRQHPGRNAEDSLRADLRNTHTVVTWGSGAAIKAIAMGCYCYNDFDKWIGAAASSGPIPKPMQAVWRFEEDRTPMFERLACAQWRVSEIESGLALSRLLEIA